MKMLLHLFPLCIQKLMRFDEVIVLVYTRNKLNSVSPPIQSYILLSVASAIASLSVGCLV